MRNSKQYLGQTVDNVHRVVHVFSDTEKLYAVYYIGEPVEYTTSADITDVKSDPDKYMYTPFVEFT